jgi:hypothetical protein
MKLNIRTVAAGAGSMSTIMAAFAVLPADDGRAALQICINRVATDWRERPIAELLYGLIIECAEQNRRFIDACRARGNTLQDCRDQMLPLMKAALKP